MKKVFSLLLLLIAGQAYAMETSLPGSHKQMFQAALGPVKAFNEKELLQKYAKVKQDAEQALRTYDATPKENRWNQWLEKFMDSELQNIRALQTAFNNNKEAIKDVAKKDEIEMNLAILSRRLEKIDKSYKKMKEWAREY